MYETVAGHHRPAARVKKTGRFMGQHGADELARRAGKQARVRVEGEYIPRPREGLRIPGQDFQAAGALAQEPARSSSARACARSPTRACPGPGLPARGRREVEAAAVFFCSAPPRRARRRASPGVRGQLGGFGLRQVRQQAEGQVPPSRAGEGELLKPPGQLRPRVLPRAGEETTQMQRPSSGTPPASSSLGISRGGSTRNSTKSQTALKKLPERRQRREKERQAPEINRQARGQNESGQQLGKA